MQKKILLPLVMTVPAAMPALANIPLGFPEDAASWEKSGVTSDDWVNYAQKSVTCPVGTAYVTVKLGELPAGKYFFRFDSGNNIAIEVDGKTYAVGTDGDIPDGGGVSAPVTHNGGNMEVKIKAKDTSIGFKFQVKCVTLEVLKERYTEVNKAYTHAKWELRLDDVDTNDDFKEAVALRERKQNYKTKDVEEFEGRPMDDVIADLKTMIKDDITVTEIANKQSWLDLYEKYGLDKTPSTILEYFNGMDAKVEAYNEEVKAENEVWARYNENVKTRSTLLSEQSTLLTNAQALKDDVDKFLVTDPALKQAHVKAINDFIVKLNEYKSRIDAAYPDPADYPTGDNSRALRAEITFEDENTTLTEELTTLKNDFDAFKKDYNAYYDINFVQLTNLQNAYKNYVDFLNSVKGVEGYEDVYNDLVIGVGEGVSFENPTSDSKLGTANALYETTKSENKIEAVKGAYVDSEAKKAAIQAVIDGWANLKTEFETLVKDQNTNMTECGKVVEEWLGNVAEYNKLTVPEHLKNQFDAKLKTLTDAINAYKDLVEEKYGAHELDKEALDVTDVTDAIADMDKFVEPMANIQDLLAKLEAAKAEVAKNGEQDVTGDDEGEETVVKIADRFNTTYEGLKNSIVNLTLEQANDKTITDPIENEIEKYQKDAQTYADNLKEVNKIIAGLEASYTGLGEFITAKIFDEYKTDANTYLKRVKEVYAETWKEFDKDIKGYRSDMYQAAIALNDQESFTQLANLLAALKVATGETGDLAKEDFDNAKAEFSLAGTNANMTFARSLVDAFDTVLAEHTAVTNPETLVTHAEEISLKEVNEALNAVDIAGAEGDITKLAACDNAIKAALDQLQLLKDKFNDLKENQDNYNTLNAAYGALLPELDKLIEYNANNSLTPALEYFRDEVIGTVAENSKKDTLGKQLFDLKAELDKALQDTKIHDGKENAALDQKIKDLGEAIKDTKTAIEENNKNHNKQVDKEKEERAHALEVIGMIDETGAADGSADLETMKNWKAELESIIDNDIAAENVVVTNAYGEGQSAAQNETIMGVYEDIHNRIQAIQDQLKGDTYKGAVKEANNNMTGSWDASYYQDLMTKWRKAIQDYNYYYYDLKNKGWSDFVHEEIKRHYDQFASHADIDNLNEAFNKYLADQNAKPHVITKDEWDVWTSEAGKIRDAIADRVQKLEEDANRLAKEYYAQQHAAAADAITEATAALSKAGVAPELPMAEANKHIADAEMLYGNAKPDAEYPENVVGRGMNDIADELDKVIPSIDVQKACKAAWADMFDRALKEIAGLKDIVNGEDAKFCPKDVKAAWMTDFREKEATVNDLNTEVSGITADLVKVYADYAQSLDELVKAMQNDVDEILKCSALNKENQKIYDDFSNTWLPDLQNSLKALEDFVNALGASGNMDGTLNNIEGAIDALEDKVDANMDNEESLQDVQQEVDNIQTSINNAYQTAADAEISWLRDMLKTTQTAFNDAMVRGTGELNDRLAALGSDKKQKDIESEIHTIDDALSTFTYDADKKDEFKTTARGYETDLCALYDLLQQTWTDSPAAAIRTALDELYSEIDGKITEGQKALGECVEDVQTEFAGQYEALKSALDDQKAAWDGNGSDVIAREASYKRTLDDIKGKVEQLAIDVEAAQKAALEKAEKERVNAEKYTALKAEFDGLQTEFDEAKALVAGYDNEIAKLYDGEEYKNYISNMYADFAKRIQNALDTALAALEQDNANVALTQESVLQNGAGIAYGIDAYRLLATRSYAAVQFSAIDGKDTELSNKLSELNIIPSIRTEINDALVPLRDNVLTIRGEYRTADFERLTAIIADAKAYIGQYDELLNKVQENSFVPGDVEADPDHEVSAVDVQQVIAWIGEDMTFDDLVASNPRQAYAADVNGDSKINIADVVAISNIILNDLNNPSQAPRLLVKGVQTAAENNLTVALGETVDGVREYAVMINNTTAFVGGQLDINVGAGMEIVDIELTERGADHKLYRFDNNSGARVVIASMANDELRGNSGAMLIVRTRGAGNLTVGNAVFADINATAYGLAGEGMSAIDSIGESFRNAKERIYNVAGQALDRIQRGVNIIRKSDGTTTKEMH